MSNIQSWRERTKEQGITPIAARDEEIAELRRAFLAATQDMAEMAANLREIEDLHSSQKATLYAKCADLRNERDAALKSNAAIQLDTDRLDWLLSHEYLRVQGSKNKWHVLDCSNGLAFVASNEKTNRAAIDAAMKFVKK